MVILSLAFAIGANTAIFSIVNVLILRDLPVANPHELVELGRETPNGLGNFSYPLYERVRDQNTVFSDVLAVSSPTVQSEVDGADRPPIGRYVSGSFFETLVPAALGRLLTPNDDRPNTPEGPTLAVIGYGLWQRNFGADQFLLVLSTRPWRRHGVVPLVRPGPHSYTGSIAPE